MADYEVLKLGDTADKGDYSITDASKITITNNNTIGTLVGTEYRVKLTYGTDNKVIEPDVGFITKFNPILTEEATETEDEYKYVVVPKEFLTVKLPLYRAGEGTCVAIEVGASVKITPTLSEEVAYYEEACDKLGLTFAYVNA